MSTNPPADPPPEWMPPRNTYFIATTARSGSNFLCSAIAKVGVLGRPTEYLDPIAVGRAFGENLESTVELCLHAKRRGETSDGVLGIKLFPEHFDRAARDIVFGRWFPVVSGWVWLRRRDLLGQAISHVIAHQTSSWTSTAPVRGPAFYDSEAISRLIGHIATSNVRWEMYFARNGITPLELWYEDIAANVGPAVEAVARLAGVALPPGTAFDDLLRLQRTGLNEEFRSRYLAEHADMNTLPPAPVVRRHQSRQEVPPKSTKAKLAAPPLRSRLARAARILKGGER